MVQKLLVHALLSRDGVVHRVYMIANHCSSDGNRRGCSLWSDVSLHDLWGNERSLDSPVMDTIVPTSDMDLVEPACETCAHLTAIDDFNELSEVETLERWQPCVMNAALHSTLSIFDAKHIRPSVCCSFLLCPALFVPSIFRSLESYEPQSA